MNNIMLTQQSIKDLLLHEESPSISLYMPLHKKGSKEKKQDEIRYKNLLSEAEEQLKKKGLRAVEVAELLHDAASLNVHNISSHGIAVFFSPHSFTYYKLSESVSEMLFVDEHFYTKPLMPLVAANARFFLLSISKNHVILYEGTKNNIHEVHIPHMPESMGEALWYKDVEKQYQFHTNTGVRRGKHGGSMGHGQALWKDNEKSFIKKYFRTIDHAIHPFIRNTGAPLVVSVDKGLFPLYQEANTYQHLIHTPLAQNPEQVTEKELHVEAWPIIEQQFEKEKDSMLHTYADLTNTDKVRSSLEDIIHDAHDGIVDTLFVEKGKNVWGTYNPASREVRIEKTHTPDNEDLLNYATQQVYIHGGKVFVLPSDKMPTETGYAEISRYAH